MDRLILIIAALIIISALMSLLLLKFFSSKWIWYLPSMIGATLILFVFLKIEFEALEGFQGIGYVIMILMIAAIIVGNLLANIFVSLRMKKKWKK